MNVRDIKTKKHYPIVELLSETYFCPAWILSHSREGAQMSTVAMSQRL